MKLTIYTACFDSDEESFPLHEPAVRSSRAELVAFMGDRRGLEHSAWRRKNVEAGMAPRHMARALKIVGGFGVPGDADATIWLDSRFTIEADLYPLALQLWHEGHDIAAFPHPDRSCLEAEAAEIIRLGKADAEATRSQLARITAQGFGPELGTLTSTGFLYRRNTPEVAAFCEEWWHDVLGGTLRDQMSVDYAAHRCGIEIHHLPGTYRCNPWTRWDPTPKRQPA